MRLVANRAFAVFTVAAVLSLTACGANGSSSDDAHATAVLGTYRPLYDAIRATLVHTAGRLPTTSPTAASCTRRIAPTFDDVQSDGDFGEPGNTEVMRIETLPEPYQRPDFDPGDDLDTFLPVSGYLSNGLWLTGREDPLRGTDVFAVGSEHANVGITNEQDPSRRLKLLLDAGLKVRYVIAVRVTGYRPPGLDPVDPRYGSGATPTGDVTVDAFVIDLEQHDVPCSFTAHGEARGVAMWTAGTADQAIYKDIQTSLALNIDDRLKDLAARAS